MTPFGVTGNERVKTHLFVEVGSQVAPANSTEEIWFCVFRSAFFSHPHFDHRSPIGAESNVNWVNNVGAVSFTCLRWLGAFTFTVHEWMASVNGKRGRESQLTVFLLLLFSYYSHCLYYTFTHTHTQIDCFYSSQLDIRTLLVYWSIDSSFKTLNQSWLTANYERQYWKVSQKGEHNYHWPWSQK